MLTPTWTLIVASDAYNSQRITGVIRQVSKYKSLLSFYSGQPRLRNNHARLKDRIHAPSYTCYFVGREISIKMIVALRLLFLDVCAEGSPAAKHSNHSLVQNMLGCVHVRIVFFTQAILLISALRKQPGQPSVHFLTNSLPNMKPSEGGREAGLSKLLTLYTKPLTGGTSDNPARNLKFRPEFGQNLCLHRLLLRIGK